MSSAEAWLGWTWPLLLAAASVAMINSLREGPTQALSTCYQFVLVQFVELGRPGGPMSIEASEERATAT
jgi:hypothetical protein